MSLAAFFVVSFVFWPYPLDSVIHIVQLGIWLLAGVVMTILFAYDAKWYLLPDRATILLAGLGLVSAILAVIDAQVPFTAGMSVVGALALLPGVYLALYLFSKGQWVGLIVGLKREEAARFSFLLGIPAILGSGIYELVELLETGINSSDYLNLIVGIFASFVVGYLSIEFLLRFLRIHGTMAFVIYRILLGTGILVFLV